MHKPARVAAVDMEIHMSVAPHGRAREAHGRGTALHPHNSITHT